MTRIAIALLLTGLVAGCGLPPDIVGPTEARLEPALPADEPSPVTARLIGTSLAETVAEPPGRWLAMAGIERPVPGWVTDQETGRSAQVELRPLSGEGIDRISLEALIALGIDEARLVVLDVYYDAAALRVAG